MVKDVVGKDDLLVTEDVGEHEEDHHDHIGAKRPLEGFLRRNSWRHRVLAPGAAAEVGRDISAPDDKKD